MKASIIKYAIKIEISLQDRFDILPISLPNHCCRKAAMVTMLGLSLFGTNAAAECVQGEDHIIDSFKEGPSQIVLGGNGEPEQSDIQIAPSVPGGVRLVQAVVKPDDTRNKGNARATIQIAEPPGKLIWSSNYGSPGRLSLRYGNDAVGQNNPLDHSFKGYKSLSLDFEGSDLGTVVHVTLYSGNGTARAYLSGHTGINRTLGKNQKFTVSLPFDRLSAPVGFFDLADVDYISVILNTGNAAMSEDYAITCIYAEMP